jgi:transcriptional regulator with XRE-family HTH domain
VGASVKKRRKDANLSREQVAEAAHCSSSSVQGVEIGRATTLDIIEQVIGGLNVLLAKKGLPLFEANLGTVPKSWLQLPKKEWKVASVGPGALLDPMYCVVEFHGQGRKDELERLEKWCLDKDASPLKAYAAEGGMGKTRLALELCLKMKKSYGWEAGFLRHDNFPLDGSHWRELNTVGKELLVVVDYAGSPQKTPILQQLILTLDSAPLKRIRLLMLDRDTLWLGRLRSDKGVADLLDGNADCDLKTRLGPVAKSEQERCASFVKAAQTFAPFAHPKPYLGPIPNGPQKPTSTIYDRILVLHMQALEVVNGGTETKTMAAVIRRTLGREREYWERMLPTRGIPGNLLLGVEEAVVAIGKVGGVASKTDAVKLFKSLPILADQSNVMVEQIAGLLREIYPDDENGISPLQPDLLRHCLADEWL